MKLYFYIRKNVALRTIIFLVGYKRKDTHTVAREKIKFSLLLFYGPKRRKTETFITFPPFIRLGNGMK